MTYYEKALIKQTNKATKISLNFTVELIEVKYLDGELKLASSHAEP